MILVIDRDAGGIAEPPAPDSPAARYAEASAAAVAELARGLAPRTQAEPSLPYPIRPGTWRELAERYLFKSFATRDSDTFLERTSPDQAPSPSAR